jgi:Tir chaperone protein (CesT) family
MNEQTHLRDRLIELAEGEASVLSLVQIAEDDFVLRFESGIDVEVENLTDTGHAALSSMIGTPAETERLRVYEAMLIYGMLWRDNGGVHMALTEPRGALVQLAEIPASDLTQHELTAVIKNFAEKALIWRAFLVPEATGDRMPKFLEQELRA